MSPEPELPLITPPLTTKEPPEESRKPEPGEVARRNVHRKLEKPLVGGAWAVKHNFAVLKSDELESYAALADGRGDVWRWKLSTFGVDLMGPYEVMRHEKGKKVWSAHFNHDGSLLATSRASAQLVLRQYWRRVSRLSAISASAFSASSS